MNFCFLGSSRGNFWKRGSDLISPGKLNVPGMEICDFRAMKLMERRRAKKITEASIGSDTQDAGLPVGHDGEESTSSLVHLRISSGRHGDVALHTRNSFSP